MILHKSDQKDELKELHGIIDVQNKMHYIDLVGNSLEHNLRNSIDVKFLIKQEQDGIGDMSISETLDVIQDLHSSGQTELFSDITLRRRPVNRNRNEKLIKEVSEYRKILEYLMKDFSKKSKGYQAYAEAIRILLDNIDRS